MRAKAESYQQRLEGASKSVFHKDQVDLAVADYANDVPALLREVEALREKEAEARARSTYWKKQHDKRRDETNKATQKAYYAEQKRQAEEKDVDRIHQWLLETRVERDHLRKRLAKAEDALREIAKYKQFEVVEVVEAYWHEEAKNNAETEG